MFPPGELALGAQSHQDQTISAKNVAIADAQPAMELAMILPLPSTFLQRPEARIVCEPYGAPCTDDAVTPPALGLPRYRPIGDVEGPVEHLEPFCQLLLGNA